MSEVIIVGIINGTATVTAAIIGLRKVNNIRKIQDKNHKEIKEDKSIILQEFEKALKK